jgi:hypothetical protein
MGRISTCSRASADQIGMFGATSSTGSATETFDDRAPSSSRPPRLVDVRFRARGLDRGDRGNVGIIEARSAPRSYPTRGAHARGETARVEADRGDPQKYALTFWFSAASQEPRSARRSQTSAICLSVARTGVVGGAGYLQALLRERPRNPRTYPPVNRIRVRDQSECREGARSRSATNSTRPRRRGGRITSSLLRFLWRLSDDGPVPAASTLKLKHFCNSPRKSRLAAVERRISDCKRNLCGVYFYGVFIGLRAGG